MPENCILFTSSFPYGDGEEFLETELPYLERTFKRVYIFSFGSQTKNLRQVGKNVVVYSLNLKTFFLKRIRKICCGLFHREFKKNRKTLKTFLMSCYFLGTSYIGYKRALKVIKKGKIDLSNSLLYSYWFNETALTAVLLKNKFFKNVKIVSRAHGSDLYDYAQPLGFNPYQNIIAKNVDFICCISKHGFNYITTKYPDIASKTSVHRLGILNHNERLNRNFNSPYCFVTCSNLIPLKRVSLFAEAFIKVASKNNNVFWYCIGDGPDFAGIRRVLTNSSLEDKVSFLGRVSNSEVIKFYENTDVFVFVNSSLTEGIPVSVMEAMSFGIPCIATNVGGTSEIVDDTCGLLISKELDSELLAQHILTFMKSGANEYYKKRDNAKRKWNKYFNADVNYNHWCEFLKNI